MQSFFLSFKPFGKPATLTCVHHIRMVFWIITIIFSFSWFFPPSSVCDEKVVFTFHRWLIVFVLFSGNTHNRTSSLAGLLKVPSWKEERVIWRCQLPAIGFRGFSIFNCCLRLVSEVLFNFYFEFKLSQFKIVSCLRLASVEVAHAPGKTHVVGHTPCRPPDNNDVIEHSAKKVRKLEHFQW